MAVSLDDRAWPSLVRFAAVSLVDRSGMSRTDLARAMNRSSPSFHMSLFGRAGGQVDETISRSFVKELQRVLQTHPSVGAREDDAGAAPRRPATMLTGLYEELAAERDPGAGVEVHAAWFPDLCRAGPARETVEVLLRGEALWDMLHDLGGVQAREHLLAHGHDEHARRAIQDLLAVAGTSKGAPAVLLLARLGHVALPEIALEIYQSPVGFRCVRALGRMLWRARYPPRSSISSPSRGDDELLAEIERVLIAVRDQPPVDPYPARSLYVEALRYAPDRWAWVEEELRRRTSDAARPVRERMYAALVCVLRHPDPEPTDDLLGRLADESDDGLRYAAAVLGEYRRTGVLDGWLDDGKVPADGLREWPRGRPEARCVQRVVEHLRQADARDVPPAVREGLETLVSEAILALDGTRRRRACDVIAIAQLDGPVSSAIGAFLDERPVRAPRWLREHAAFVLGYLQHQNAIPALARIIVENSPRSPSDGQVDDPSVVHAAAWGVGDLCGRGHPHEHAAHVPVDALVDLLWNGPHEVRPAAAYALATTRQPGGLAAQREVLERSREDRLVRAFARWGIWLAEAETNKGRIDAPVYIPASRSIPMSS